MNEIFNFDNGNNTVFGIHNAPTSESFLTPAAFFVDDTTDTMTKLKTIIQKYATNVKRSYNIHKTISELSKLDDLTLEDIGVMRQEIRSIAIRATAINFWQPKK